MIKNILITNVTTTGATISGKLGYTVTPEVNELKVYTFTYNQTNFKFYVNGELISTSACTGAMRVLNDIYIGADYDDTEHFKGQYPAIAFYDTALSDSDRVNLENWYADRWLPSGTTMASGHVVTQTASTKPIVTGNAFLDFDAEGLLLSAGTRVTGWTDSSVFGTQRTASPKPTTSLGITTIKGKNALVFDQKSYMKVLTYTAATDNPASTTIIFVAKFDNYDTSFYSGDAAQTLLGANANTAIRIKKFDATNPLETRFGTNSTSFKTIFTPKNTIIGPSGVFGSGSVYLRISSDSGFTTFLSSSTQIASGTTNYGVTKHSFSGLSANTKYYGKFVVDSVVETGNTLSFRTFKNSNSFKMVVGSCNQSGSQNQVWTQMLTEDADLFVHMGDLNYENILSPNAQLYANAQDISFSSTVMSTFFKNVPSTYIYDNHDSLGANPNNTYDWTTFLPFWSIAYPTYPLGSPSANTNGHYWAWTIGRTRCIMTNNRVNRDPIQATPSPSKTNLGITQKAWLKAELLAAKNAGQSVLWFGGICMIADADNPLGLSYDGAGMTWGNYVDERREICNYIFDNQIPNVTYVQGDSHMICIDDGRDCIYSTVSGTTRRTYKSFDDKFLIRNLASSPFDKDADTPEGGPFQINDVENSGGPTRLYSDPNPLSQSYGYAQAYGKIEVTDIGEDWQQVKLSNTAWNGTGWTEYLVYTFNSPMSGTPGLPPQIINTTLPNLNGYVGDGGEFKRIQKRYIGLSGTWKTQEFKFIGENGFWKLAYNDTDIKTDTFFVNALEGYTLNTENVVTLYGYNLLDYGILSPRSGAYYELTKNVNDLFDNFSLGSYIGTPAPASNVAGKTSLLITGTSQGFAFPFSGGGPITAVDLVGVDGSKSFTLSANVFVPNLTALTPIFSYGNRNFGMEIFVENSGSVRQRVWQSNSVITNITTSANSVTTGWTNVVIDRVATLGRIFLGYENVIPAVTGVTTFPATITGSTIKVGNNFNASGGTYSVIGSAYRFASFNNKILSPNNIGKLLDRKLPIPYLLSGSTLTKIPSQWINSIQSTYVKMTVPTGTTLGNYDLFIRYTGSIEQIYPYDYLSEESFAFPVSIVSGNVSTSAFTDNFSDTSTLNSNYYILNKAWGGANGGVVKENVYIENGQLILQGNGDRYTGTIQGVDRFGLKKYHTVAGDPLLGQPWRNRVGACIVYNKRTGFGSYEVDALIPNKLGTAYAFWTFFYNEIYPGDPRYQEFQNEGLHEQGNVADGFYITRNHEIDIELPSHLSGGTYNNPTLSHMKNNNWRGELENESNIMLTDIGFSVADGNFHKFRFDWTPSAVTFYIDGVLKQTNTLYVPDIAGYFTFGTWFPSSPLSAKPWLVNPNNAWAGGVVDPDGGMKADFNTVKMKVRSFSFTPFNIYLSQLRTNGETYPFGGTVKKN